MKLKILSILLIFWIGKGAMTNAQVVNFPDENFLEYILLYTTVDSNKDGEIQITEAEAFTGTFTINTGVTNLGGIEHFKNLTRLGIYNAAITALNLTQNTKLDYLEVRQTKVTSLNISNNTQLTQLSLDYNEFLTDITVGSKPELQRLSVTFDKITTVDVSLCPKLNYLNLTNNLITSLDLSQVPRLASLNVSANKLTALDVSKNTRLTVLTLGYNNIPTLDLSKNTLLDIAMLQGNPLTTIDVSKNIYLTQLVVDDTDLTNIDISMLSMLRFFYANFTSLEKLDASKNESLIYISAVNSGMSFINFKNNNNTNVFGFFATNSPNLKCIQVDDPAYSSSQPLWEKDSTAVYATDCSSILATGEVKHKKLSVYPNPTTGMLYLNEKASVISVYNTAGQLVADFEDAESVNLSKLPAGTYFVKTFNNNDKAYTTTKVIKN